MGSRPDFDSPDKASAGIIDPRTAAASKCMPDAAGNLLNLKTGDQYGLNDKKRWRK
jgi:hypothetical protein